jgi:hypothetical protein
MKRSSMGASSFAGSEDASNLANLVRVNHPLVDWERLWRAKAEG